MISTHIPEFLEVAFHKLEKLHLHNGLQVNNINGKNSFAENEVKLTMPMAHVSFTRLIRMQGILGWGITYKNRTKSTWKVTASRRIKCG